MVPAYHFKPLGLRSLIRLEHVLTGHRKAVAGRIVAAIHQRKEPEYFAHGFGIRGFQIAPQQSSATFMGIRFRAMHADFLRQVTADPQRRFVRHG